MSKRSAIKLIPCILIINSLIIITGFTQETNFKKLQNDMIKTQLMARGISDKNVLNAFYKVERHHFVSDEYKKYAYSDSPLPIDEGQTISQPYIVAYMTEILNLKQKSKILEIGTGSGYQAAILSQICDTVYTIEIFKSLAQKAHNLFNKLNYNNIKLKIGDGFKGWPEYSPYDAIIVTCAPSKVPEILKEQLAEGGRIVIPVGNKGYQNLILLQKKRGKIIQKKILPVRFVPMINKEGEKY